jgi:hypothetical protein
LLWHLLSASRPGRAPTPGDRAEQTATATTRHPVTGRRWRPTEVECISAQCAIRRPHGPLPYSRRRGSRIHDRTAAQFPSVPRTTSTNSANWGPPNRFFAKVHARCVICKFSFMYAPFSLSILSGDNFSIGFEFSGIRRPPHRAHRPRCCTHFSYSNSFRSPRWGACRSGLIRTAMPPHATALRDFPESKTMNKAVSFRC